MDNKLQATLSDPINIKGRGLHLAKRTKITLLPAPVDSGIVFRRVDKKALNTEIKADWKTTKNKPLCTCIEADNGFSVRTIEHLMAAFYACRIDNVIVEINGDEVPVLDGSALPFIKEIEKAGISYQDKSHPIFRITQAVEVSEGNRKILIEPAETLYLDVTIILQKIGRLNWSGEITPEIFKDEIAAARTFGRLKNGLLAKLTRFQKNPVCLGANTKSAVVIVGDKPINKGGLRMPDELVFHRILDLVGDLMLSGGHIQGKITATSPAHRLTHALLKKAFEEGSIQKIR